MAASPGRTVPTRDALAAMYLDQLPYRPYPVQEEALLAWFTAKQGVLVCAPTGMGKTLIAEAALFEALHTGSVAYYTTPLIALTEQKFGEMQAAAARWGFEPHHVGLVTGNRCIHPDARVLVVVAEILFNRLLHRAAYSFDQVSAVVMDEFHSFNDRERGIIWEFTLGLLPPHVRTLLLSATVGNAFEFTQWLKHQLGRDLELVQGTERRVPLTFHWVGDMLLNEQIEQMAEGDLSHRRLPALIFCFNREECWTVAEQLKGKSLLLPGQQAQLADVLKQRDLSAGVGPKLKQILQRGVGVHHAGVLPKHRRLVEELFQQKLLSVCVCTETLAAGINLPARSVVLPSLMKGPPGEKKLIDASTAHQMFGRAGRPQYDDHGFVYVLAHEDDVKIARWREKYDQIPEGTKDPGLLKAKKALKKKMPTRRTNEQYWTEAQFEKLRTSPPAKLYSRGPLPWRMLAYMLEVSGEVSLVRKLVARRLMDSGRLERAQRDLDAMLYTLHRAGYVTLEPDPPEFVLPDSAPPASRDERTRAPISGILRGIGGAAPRNVVEQSGTALPRYQAEFARPTPRMDRLKVFRSVNPLYGAFLVDQLGIADRSERLQALESVLEIPGSVAHFLRVPPRDMLPPGPLAMTRLDEQLLELGLASAEELTGEQREGDEELYYEDGQRVYVLTLADKLKRLFDYEVPGIRDVRIQPVWAAGEVIEFADFNKYVTSKRLQTQEGILFRHLLRLILLLGEFACVYPADADPLAWCQELEQIAAQLTDICLRVDAGGTAWALEQGKAEGEFTEATVISNA